MEKSRASSSNGQVPSTIKNNWDLADFKSVFDSDRVQGQIDRYYPNFRNRGLGPTVTLGAWITQNLAADRTCSAAIDRVNSDRIANGFEPLSSATGAYCCARERVPEDLLKEMLCREGVQLEQCVPEKWNWNKKSVILVDGMVVTLCDTPAIKEEFPQSENQKKINSLPQARIVGLLSLATGALLDVAIGPYCGKETGEHALLRQLMPTLNSEEVLLGDGIYPSFFCMASLIEKGIDGVFAAGIRNVDFRTGEKLGTKDHIVIWEKPRRPEWMTLEEYERYPSSIKIRELETSIEKPGFRSENKVIFTTILSRKEASKEKISLLFSRRWEIEVHFRSIKSDLQMDFIPTKTPEMVRKDIYITLLGYNLIRTIMSEAAAKHGCFPTQISFKRTVQIFESYRRLWEIGNLKKEDIYKKIMYAIGKIRVGNRPNRSEPRRVRRTKDRFPTLKMPRNSY